jgi:hypothetical protein
MNSKPPPDRAADRPGARPDLTAAPKTGTTEPRMGASDFTSQSGAARFGKSIRANHPELL